MKESPFQILIIKIINYYKLVRNKASFYFVFDAKSNTVQFLLFFFLSSKVWSKIDLLVKDNQINVIFELLSSASIGSDNNPIYAYIPNSEKIYKRSSIHKLLHASNLSVIIITLRFGWALVISTDYMIAIVVNNCITLSTLN